MNWDLILYLSTAVLLGMNLGIFVYKREFDIKFYTYLVWVIVYILAIAKLN